MNGLTINIKCGRVPSVNNETTVTIYVARSSFISCTLHC